MSLPSTIKPGTKNLTCNRFVENEITFIQANYPNIPVIVTNRWAFYLNGKLGDNKPIIEFLNESNDNLQGHFEKKMQSMFCALSKTNDMYVIKPTPEFVTELPKTTAKDLLNGGLGNIKIALNIYEERNSVVNQVIDKMAKACKVKVLNPVNYLCYKEACHGALQGNVLYYDDNHLSEYGNRLLIPMFKDILL